tara:strand:- start:282 stop:941 length:660 start_codon:yes stop_codon:yes gene_type:complete
MQNISHAVMAQRSEKIDSLDDFPTPPWATRAFLEYILNGKNALSHQTCLEPACNRGYMSMVLEEYFMEVKKSDIFDYGCGDVKDFLLKSYKKDSFDWVITNPPFKAAENFIHESLKVARVGVAMLVRTVFLESLGRYQRLFSIHPPTYFAQYVERVPMVKGRLDKKASTATGYGWVVWLMDSKYSSETLLKWIPPSRKIFEYTDDYKLVSTNNYLENTL